MKWLILLAIAQASSASAQSVPYKLVITWYQANLTIIDYPNAVRCDAARLAVVAEAERRAEKARAEAERGGGQIIGSSPNGAFCIPG